MTNEKVRIVLFDFLAFVVKKSATASRPLVLYLLIKLSNLLWLLLLLLLVILFAMNVEGIEVVAICQQQIHAVIRLIYLFSIVTNYFYSERLRCNTHSSNCKEGI